MNTETPMAADMWIEHILDSTYIRGQPFLDSYTCSPMDDIIPHLFWWLSLTHSEPTARNFVSFLVSSFIPSFLWFLCLLLSASLSFFCLFCYRAEHWAQVSIMVSKDSLIELHPLHLLVVMLSSHASAEVSCFGSSLNQICSLTEYLIVIFLFLMVPGIKPKVSQVPGKVLSYWTTVPNTESQVMLQAGII